MLTTSKGKPGANDREVDMASEEWVEIINPGLPGTKPAKVRSSAFEKAHKAKGFVLLKDPAKQLDADGRVPKKGGSS